MKIEELQNRAGIQRVMGELGLQPESFDHTDNPEDRAMVLNGLKKAGYDNPDSEIQAVEDAVMVAYPGLNRTYAKNIAYTLVANTETIKLHLGANTRPICCKLMGSTPSGLSVKQILDLEKLRKDPRISYFDPNMLDISFHETDGKLVVSWKYDTDIDVEGLACFLSSLNPELNTTPEKEKELHNENATNLLKLFKEVLEVGMKPWMQDVIIEGDTLTVTFTGDAIGVMKQALTVCEYDSKGFER